jgi:hypothetical protein
MTREEVAIQIGRLLDEVEASPTGAALAVLFVRRDDTFEVITWPVPPELAEKSLSFAKNQACGKLRLIRGGKDGKE